jgi:hypothetical protein
MRTVACGSIARSPGAARGRSDAGFAGSEVMRASPAAELVRPPHSAQRQRARDRWRPARPRRRRVPSSSTGVWSEPHTVDHALGKGARGASRCAGCAAAAPADTANQVADVDVTRWAWWMPSCWTGGLGFRPAHQLARRRSTGGTGARARVAHRSRIVPNAMVSRRMECPASEARGDFAVVATRPWRAHVLGARHTRVASRGILQRRHRT